MIDIEFDNDGGTVDIGLLEQGTLIKLGDSVCMVVSDSRPTKKQVDHILVDMDDGQLRHVDLGTHGVVLHGRLTCQIVGNDSLSTYLKGDEEDEDL